MKTRILRILRNSEGYVSGQSICDELGVSRTAVWKNIKLLKEDGYEIDSVSNRGYRITGYPDVLTKAEIESVLPDNCIVKRVWYAQETDSTNSQAKKAAETASEYAGDGTLFITECQTGGRGRRGKKWISPEGSGIWMSLLIRPDIKPANASMLTIIAAMAVTQALAEVAVANNMPVECKIKWPNDVVLNGKKVCGILTEMSAEMDFVNYVVVGIGINVNTTEFEASIKDMATSIYNETGTHIKRSELVKYFSKAFTQNYDIYLKTQDLSGIKDKYNNMLINKGRQVRVCAAYNQESFTGVAMGIDDSGQLLIIKDDGTSESVTSGEVSVRGLYGYV